MNQNDHKDKGLFYRLTLEALNFLAAKDFLQFESIMTVLVSSFRFIWIPMLWVYGH